MEAQHHRYSASGAEGWLTCPGKLAMEGDMSDRSSSAADEGSAAHFLASECLTSKLRPELFLNTEIVCWSKKGGRDGQEFSHRKLPKDAVERSRWTVDADMVRHITSYINYIKKKTRGHTLQVERRVYFGRYIGVDGAFGTSDAYILSKDRSELTVIDLKYGYKEVSAYKNPQAMLYALGVVDELALLEDITGLRKITLVIFQPRLLSEPICPEWSCSLGELLDLSEVAKKAVTLSEAAIKGLSNATTERLKKNWITQFLRTSEKGCMWCRAKAVCPSLALECASRSVLPVTIDDLDDLDSVLEGVLVEESPALQAVPWISFEALTTMYEMREQVKDWIKAVEERMLSEMLSGVRHPRYKLVAGRKGNRAWSDEAAVVEQLKKLKLKKAEMFEQKLVSPAALEKKLKKERPDDWRKLDPLLTRSEGKPQIASVDDKRPSINPYDDALSALPKYQTEADLFDDLIG